MRGDFTRDSFQRDKAFTRVLAQQGRFQLDADANEQVSIFWDYLRALTRDLLGPHAGPESNCGFAIIPSGDVDKIGLTPEHVKQLRGMLRDSGDFLIGPGVYFVDGFRAVNGEYVRYTRQSHMQRAQPLRTSAASHLIYLDVWEHEISPLQDPSIREAGLNGADTAERAHLVWQVRSYEMKGGAPTEPADWDVVTSDWRSLTERWQSRNRGLLRVQTVGVSDGESLEPSTISPESKFRGPLNQLYRVEIHHGGTAKDGATFKWSRENGSVCFAIAGFADPIVTLAAPPRDTRFGLSAGDWVELSDDDSVFEHIVHPLRQVESVDTQKNTVTLKGKAVSTVGTRPDRHPVLTRWDHKQGDPRRGGLELRDGSALIREGSSIWHKLEQGVQIQFEPGDSAQRYRSGDYWLIPARRATGAVEWPVKDGEPQALPPKGIEHHYAPLAIVGFEGNELTSSRNFRLKAVIQTAY